jgi:hypothetical protein
MRFDTDRAAPPQQPPSFPGPAARMNALQAPAAALAWLGRRGTIVVAASIFIGVALPPLAAFFRPLLTAAIFTLLCLAFLRVDPSALRAYWRRPALVLGATAWTMLAVPTLLGTLFVATGIAERAPGLMPALMLQAAGPPLTAAPAFALLLGLDAALTLTVLVLAVIATPITAPAFAQLFLGDAMPLSPFVLGLRLFLLLAGASLTAVILRRLAGNARLQRARDAIDGLNVITLFVFAVALMDGVAARIVSDPLLVLVITVLSFLVSIVIGAVTMVVFAGAGRERSFALALAAGQRNLGLMLAATGGAVPDLTWLYFALAQFPIYLAPQILKPLVRRWKKH